jgi:hypothetical protein
MQVDHPGILQRYVHPGVNIQQSAQQGGAGTGPAQDKKEGQGPDLFYVWALWHALHY